MRFGLACIAAFLSSLASAQLTEPALVAKYEREGYELQTRYQQQLNDDSFADLILIFGKKGEDSLSTAEHPVKRLFVLAKGLATNQFQVFVENKNLIYYYNYDPNFKETFVDVTFDNKAFTINHYGGFDRRWGKATTFAYSPRDKDWIFLLDEVHVTLASNPEMEIEHKIVKAKKSDKISVREFDIYSEWK